MADASARESTFANASELRASMELIRQRVTASPLMDAALTTASELRAEKKGGRAAVAIVLRELDQGPEILLIRRAERASDPWSGHMAFPGGREEPHDESLYATAVRETREEVALDLTQAGRLLGSLSVLPAIARGKNTGMMIAPFVFELTEERPLAYNPGEVSEAVWVPVEPMMRGALRTTYAYELSGQRFELPAHDYQGRIVWGLTYRMLDNLFGLLR